MKIFEAVGSRSRSSAHHRSECRHVVLPGRQARSPERRHGAGRRLLRRSRSGRRHHRGCTHGRLRRPAKRRALRTGESPTLARNPPEGFAASCRPPHTADCRLFLPPRAGRSCASFGVRQAAVPDPGRSGRMRPEPGGARVPKSRHGRVAGRIPDRGHRRESNGRHRRGGRLLRGLAVAAGARLARAALN